ncbi:MBL fold metallo-hydrolase [Acidisphaera rubrifaciens]|uniref:Metallo-beta-lactamase domain-containing protein n=1 Tax=Acidisphaera rubrifaciens HS-AP3 TaxID=1231350 RepID=A0A0D6P567_9PROT|nr:MBL fold metallo-hydrolase [Acidisphaera rubrifaciens]GAN76034.1 hypothetical protein Asru_0045_25 [Acidisphaera rubrifaciens HS-AP3]
MPFLTEAEPRRGVATEVVSGVRRIVARNPGALTYHGTNTYLVDLPDGVAVVDPGPDDAVHVAETVAAAGRPITLILLTHTHVDHVGALAALQAATRAPVAAWRQPSLTGFRPDIALDDGVAVGGITALHTPGHAADHVCFAMSAADGRAVLFSADHVMSWSTSIVSPPDGHMGAYVRSLDRLLARADDLYLPGHGPPLAASLDLVRELRAHRLGREAAIAEALRRRAVASIPELTADVYVGLAAHLMPMAERNVLAHLLKLAEEGRVERDGVAWRALS